MAPEAEIHATVGSKVETLRCIRSRQVLMQSLENNGFALGCMPQLPSTKRGLQERRASVKSAEIKGCGWVAHTLFPVA